MKARLTVENDDRASMFSVSDLLWLHGEIGIPIVFDFHVRTLSSPLSLHTLIQAVNISAICICINSMCRVL